MGRRWLLSLLCLSVFGLCLVPLTRAGGDLRVNEADTRIFLARDSVEVLLAVENSTGKTMDARVEVELLDPKNKSRAKTTQIATIAKGTQKLSLFLPISFSRLSATERSNIIWQRLRYRLMEEEDGYPRRLVTAGLISLSEITPDLFDVRVAAAEMIREGNRYQARAKATHPITRKPVANVRIEGELTLEDDNDDKDVKVRASKTTDSKGYALLDFALPPRFPQFPHKLQPAGGELHVVGRKGALVSEAGGDVLVDQFARILITTDKPLYQPAQQIHVRALLFSPSRRALANHDAHIRICDPEDLTLFRTVVKTSRFGVANVDWTIPENTRLGNYRIWVGLSDEEENDQTAYDVRISRYDLPNFSVNVEPDRKYYLPGQNAEIKVRADYLFGQPVTRGHVRVVREAEREWNYREQKWDVDEGDKYEGETDAKGEFVARIDLEDDHEKLSGSEYSRFNDITYAAYFTDPTTNRTEQRRFDVRVTKEDIHVYLVQDNHVYQHAALPLKFYISTFYADGSPAQCKVSVRMRDWNSHASEAERTRKPLATFRTNRYGVVKVSGVKLPRDLEDESEANLAISAVDSKGRKGSDTEEVALLDETLRVETDKTLYRRGEPITALITAAMPDQTVVVDLARDSDVIRSERVKLHDGRASITFPYRSEFKDRLTVAAYPDFVEEPETIGLTTVLYPRDADLKVDVQTSQASYRPGEDAQVNVSVRAPDGGSTESALGVVILDKAVEERFRTDQEFGSRGGGSNQIDSFLGLDEQFAGVTLRDLRRVDTSKFISPELDLVAAVLLSQNRDYFPTFYGDDQYDSDLSLLYGDPAREPLQPVRVALTTRYARTREYPKDEASLRRFLSEAQIDFNAVRDPWGMVYRPVFFAFPYSDDLTLMSAGPDKRFETDDDFIVDKMIWPLEKSRKVTNKLPENDHHSMVLPVNNGSIYGVVTDPIGASIPGVTVTATILNTRFTYQTTTNDDGRYSFAGLPPGIYELRFDFPSFKSAVISDVLVRAYNPTEVNAELSVGSVTETVTVSGGVNSLQQLSASVIATARKSLSRNMKIVTKSGESQISTPRLREYFPETLLWQPAIETDKDGRAQINFKLADNITTWKMIVIGSTEDGRIGTTEKEIKSFQPFFVEHEPPRVLTEGDEISLPVVVRNYLDRAQKVDLEIKPENWFSVIGPGRKQTSVAAGDATRETFDLKAISSVKNAKQRITATGSDESDAIEKPVTVHPDGEEQSVTGGDILNGSSLLELNIPETAIPNSMRGEIRIYPNLMAHVVESVEAIMERPYGCGEQTISSTYPSLLLLRHYKQTNADSPVRSRAQRYLFEGYSRLLNYRDVSGGFTYWGDGHTDLALTAYAVRFLADAAEVMEVDHQVIKDAREWLIKQQLADGSWPAKYSNERDAQQRRVVLTAYIARILAVTAGEESADSLKRAFNYLSQQGAAINEPYLLGSYALAAIHAGDASRAKPIIEKLRTLARADGTTSYWPLETGTPFHGWGLAGQIEATAIAVQALTKACKSNCDADTKLINRGLLYLLKQKDRYGVWYSTQTTINVLDAMLTLFSTKTSDPSIASTADVLVNGRTAQTVQMPVGEGLNNPITVDISESLSAGKNRIEIKRSGNLQLASVQGVVNYYVPWSAPESSRKSNDLRLRVKFDKTDGNVNDEITCNVETERVGNRGWGMILAEIGVPPGADVDRSSLETAVKNSGWTISQYDVLPDRVVVYFWPSGVVKFNFKFRPRFGLNAKTAASVVYDYYNPEARAVVAPATFRIK